MSAVSWLDVDNSVTRVDYGYHVAERWRPLRATSDEGDDLWIARSHLSPNGEGLSPLFCEYWCHTGLCPYDRDRRRPLLKLFVMGHLPR